MASLWYAWQNAAIRPLVGKGRLLMTTLKVVCVCSVVALAEFACQAAAVADQPTLGDLKQFKLGDNLSVNLPGSFQLRKVADTPLSFMAIGPSPDGTGKKRPAVILYPFAPVGERGKDDFLSAAKRATSNTMAKMGIRPTSSADIEAQNGTYGINISAETSPGSSTWWAVRTVHTEDHSWQVTIGAFDKKTFDRLTGLISDGSVFRSQPKP
jgi:hypothetical protein